MLYQLADQADPLKIEVLDASFNYRLGHRADQTLTRTAECGIEFILRKHGPRDAT